jgi:hypothetical protein
MLFSGGIRKMGNQVTEHFNNHRDKEQSQHFFQLMNVRKQAYFSGLHPYFEEGYHQVHLLGMVAVMPPVDAES